jgi:SH3 domain protein
MTRTIALVIVALLYTMPLRAETAWVSDAFTVPLRSGPSNENRIVNRGVASGTELTVLRADNGSGFTLVRTAGGVEGWISTQFIVKEPIARVALTAANNRIASLEAQAAQRSQTLNELKSSSDEAKGLEQQVAQLQTELAELKQVSADAIVEHTRSQELAALNDRLRAEVDELNDAMQRLEHNAEQRWFVIGGFLVVAGLLAGITLKARPRRSGWS